MRPPASSYKQSLGSSVRVCETHVLSAGMVPEHVPVERLAGLVDGRLAPAAGVVAEGAALGDGRVEARDLQVGVRGRRPVALLRDQPRRRHLSTETSNDTRSHNLLNIYI